MNRRLSVLTSALIVLTLAVSSCGGSEPADDTRPSSRAGAPSMDAEQFAKIRECLEAAGLADDLPSGLPSDRPSDLPSERPTERPSDMPTDRAGSTFNSPEARKALEACGIEMPEMPQPRE